MHDQHLQAAAGGGEALPLEAVDGGYLGAAHAALLGGLALEPLLVGLSDAYELARWAAGVGGGVGHGWVGGTRWGAACCRLQPPRPTLSHQTRVPQAGGERRCGAGGRQHRLGAALQVHARHAQ